MNLVKLLVFVLVGICILNEASATFNLCGNKDEVDVCETCKKPTGVTAPRPHPRQSIRLPSVPLIKTICRQETVQGPKPFEPIGDICNCGKQIVKPAPLPSIPRPSCLPSLPSLNIGRPCNCAACSSDSQKHNEHQHNSGKCSCGEPVRAPEEYQIFNNHGANVYIEKPAKKAASIVRNYHGKADAVSVAIARQLANKARNSISEKQLQYGSLKEPTIPEKTEKKVINNIREESFYETKGDVLEINSNLFHRKQVSSESESSEEEQPKHKVIEEFRPAQLRYDDIGYGVYQPSNKPRYVVVKNAPQAKHDCPHANRRPNRKNPFRTERPCGCHKDLLVDQSEISEQSVSYENNSDQYLFPNNRIST